MTRVYTPDVTEGAERLEVGGDEAHHLSRVVRVRVGETVGVFDGRGREWRAHVAEVTRQSVTLTLAGEVAPVTEPSVSVTLAIGVLKGDQMDSVIRDATVMGVSSIVPLATDHVAVPARAWRDEGASARWHRVAVSAAKQCQRAFVPTIAGVTPVGDVVSRQALEPRAGLVLACVEPGASGAIVRSAWQTLVRPASVLLLVGPEGGWSAVEMEQLAAQGAHAVSLGPRTLRAELVPAVAMATLWSTWGWT